jgi:hypothetical protein
MEVHRVTAYRAERDNSHKVAVWPVTVTSHHRGAVGRRGDNRAAGQGGQFLQVAHERVK